MEKQIEMVYGCECCGAKWRQEVKVVDGIRDKPRNCPNPRCKGEHLWIKSEDSFKQEFKENLWGCNMKKPTYVKIIGGVAYVGDGKEYYGFVKTDLTATVYDKLIEVNGVSYEND